MHPVAHQTNLISIANSHQESFEEIKVFSDEDYQSQIYPENVAQTNDEDQPNILSPVMRRNHSYSFNHMKRRISTEINRLSIYPPQFKVRSGITTFAF